MESLPLDVVQDIFSRVPTELVLECKLVCKEWGTVISRSNFVQMHLNRQLSHLHGGDDDDHGNIAANKVRSCLFFACRIDDPDAHTCLLFHGGHPSDKISIGEKYIYSQNLKRIYHAPMHTTRLFDHLVGSCNGLVCAFHHHNLILDPIYICNPLTREYVFLPELVVNKEDVDPGRIRNGEVDMMYYLACGFGYVKSTNKYKVVRINYLKHTEGNVEVYTLGSGRGWRAIGKTTHQLHSNGTYANDAIYWIWGNDIVSFDLAKEEFRLLPVPPRLQNRKVKDKYTCGLVVLGRHLCLYMDKLRMEIWTLRTSDDDPKETWCMEFDIDYNVAVVGGDSRKRRPSWRFIPILLTENGEIIFLYAKSVLYSYDTKTTFLKMISNHASDSFKGVEAIAHVNTFASFEAMGENSKRYTVRSPLEVVTDELDRVSLREGVDTTPFKLE